LLWRRRPVIWTINGAIIIGISGVFIISREASTQSSE
jgi:drug/metabolite transporter (DMT)-like permease